METATQPIEGYALSPQQQRLWQVQQTIGADAFRCDFTIYIKGPLDHSRLRSALGAVIAHHEILRTTFRYIPSLLLPVQTIAPILDESWFVIHEVDLKEIPVEVTEAFITSLLRARMSLSDEPLTAPLKATLLTISDQRHELYVSLPALCADAFTPGILASELANAYGAGQLEAEQFQYAQFAHWQNELMNSQDGQPARDFWQRQSFPTPIIPLGAARRAKSIFQPRRITFQIESEVISFLERTARERKSHVSNILLAAWQLLLWRLKLDCEGVVGCEINGRRYAELDTMPGLLSQYLPIRILLSPDLTFADVIRKVDAAVAEAHEWQEGFRFESNDAESTDTAGLRFLPACFAYQDLSTEFSSRETSFSVGQLQSFTEPFHLRFSAQRLKTKHVASLDFDPAVLAGEDVRRFAECFQTLLRSLAQTPQACIQRLNILSEQMRHEVLETLSCTSIETGTRLLVPQLFEEQVKCTPGNVAVHCEDQQLTYTELNDRADELARRLRSLGVGPDVVVAVLLEHSVELIVAILGVLKAGGAYLPLDTLYPSARLAFMLDETQAAVLLTHERLGNGFAPAGMKASPKVIYLDRSEVLAEDNGHVNSLPAPENLAYVIYTSGSTGQPKGVMISHHALSHYLHWCLNAYRVDLGEGAPLHSSIAFDLSVTSLFAPLLTGRCVFVSPAAEPGVESLTNLLKAREHFSFIKVTPSHAALLSRQLSKTDVATRAHVMIIGGEALTAQNVAYWREHAPEMSIVNEYGPTETVVGCCIYEVKKLDPTIADGAIPIGRPIVNTQAYVLDQEMQPVPMTIEGELYIGGAGLARGYWQRPELTAEKFVPHPFSTVPGERLYRTGDWVRWRNEGELEFLGRVDEQMKLRGYRIEPGEIEAMLGELPGVAAAVVSVKEEEPGDQRLVAYVARVQEAESLDSSQLREALKEQLPGYMIPSQFVLLNSLPLTANGKLDRKALAKLEQASIETQAYVAPRNPVEEMLCGIFAEVLQRQQVSITADFFELGGHSLLATQVISRVNIAFGYELPIRTLFEKTTVAGLAETLQSLMQNEKKSRPPIKRLPRAHRPSTSPQS